MAKATRVFAIPQKRLAFAVAAALVPIASQAQTTPSTLPSGGQVTSGTATISVAGTKMQIDQASQKAVLQWDSFSIGSGAWVNFSQPSSSAIALNRVLGTNPSEIFGRLTANGQVFLSNPSGVLFAPGASVDVGGLFATTLSITDRDFLAGNYNFYNAGGAGSVVNQGVITASNYAGLAGPQVRNDGIIVAKSGTVALAAGDRVTLDMIGDGLIKVSVDQAAMNASALNTGRIEADGGTVILTARSANALLDTVVNNSGVIRANSLVERNGEIVLDGGSAGVVANSGTLQAAGVDVGTTGGTLTVSGDKVSVAGVIDASGDSGGGTVAIGHGASATIIGSDAAIRADATRQGSGGFVETSGGYLQVGSAPQVGAGGTWLIDPFNISIVAGTTSNNAGAPAFTPVGNDSQIDVTLINNQLNAGANVTVDTGQSGSPGTQAGDINVNAAINKTALNASSLTLNAFNDVTISQSISLARGALTVNANRVTNNAAISANNPGNVSVSFIADGFNLGNGTVKGNAGAVVLRPRNGGNSFGIESDGATTLTNADIGSITTSDFIIIGSGQLANFTGNMTIGANAQVNGGNRNLAFFRSSNPGGSITLGANGVATTGNLIIGAGGGDIVGNGTAAGNQVQLRSTGGAIGSALAPIHTAANRLAVATNGGGAFISELDGVTLGNVNLTVGGNPNNLGNSVGVLNLSAGGPLTVVNIVDSVGGQTITAPSIAVISQNGVAAMLRNSVTGTQTVSADSISLAASTSGSNGVAFINQGGTGDQQVSIATKLDIKGGAVGSSNRAGITSNGNQAITGNADITITGGDSGTGTALTQTSNGAFISANNGAQTVNAKSITLQAGAGGQDTFATINAASQVITVSGDVLMKGGGATGDGGGARIGGPGGANPGATQLTLNAHNVTLTGGATTGATLGAATVASTVSNTITVNASGDVTLDEAVGAGAGARIGSSGTGGGDIAVNAVNIALNGVTNPTAIRTTGNVTLNATGEISEASNGAILGGAITLTAASLTNRGAISNGGGSSNTTLEADAFSLAGGTIDGGHGAVVLRPRTGTNSFGIESAGATTLTNADLASISTTDFVVIGSGQDANFTGNMTIGANAQVNGGTKNLAFFRSTNPGGSITLGANGVATAGNLIIGAGGASIVGSGIVAGNQVQLRASLGIGSVGAPVNTAANTLAINTVGTNGLVTSAFVHEVDGVSLGLVNLTVGGIANTIGTSTGPLNLTVGGALNVDATNADARITSVAGQTITADALTLHAEAGHVALIQNTSGNQSLTIGAGGINLEVVDGQGVAQIVNNRGAIANGTQTVATTGLLKVTGGSGSGSVNSGVFQNQTGKQTVTAGSIELNGAVAPVSNGGAFISNTGGGANSNQEINVAAGSIKINGGGVGFANRATIQTSGNQTITGNADIFITGGSSGTGTNDAGTNNSASISANGGGKTQTISAHDITLQAGLGGTDTNAAITSNNQTITATGDVHLTGGANDGDANGARIGAPGSSGTGTSLTLKAHDIVVKGGKTASGAAIGNSGSPNVANLPNNITIIATGDVTVSSGAGNGARIGAPTDDTGAGTITITAATGAIALNPLGGAHAASIRTAGDVVLSAASIGEGPKGQIFAGSLVANADGAVDLGGPNAISTFSGTSGGAMTLTNTGDLAVTGINAGGALSLTNIGAVTLNASGVQDAIVTSSGGQTINADGLLVHVQDGRLGRIINNGGDQTLSIGSGGINLEVVDGLGAAQIVNERGIPTNGTQNVSTTGLLNVVGGRTTDGSGTNSGVFQSQTGKQTVTAGSIELQAAVANVTTGGALIINTDGGPASDQQVNVASGTIRLTGGGVGFNNRAAIQTSGNQTITGNADIFVTGGSSGTGTNAAGTNNPAFISANTAGKTQTISAHDITLQAGPGGTDTNAAITANNQTITATGNVYLTGGANDGDANGARIGAPGNTATGTSLTLKAHDVVVKGGTTASGAAIGNSGSPRTPNLPNNITIVATGDVIVASGDGNGARIGAPADDTGAGSIQISAVNIALNPDGGAHAGVIRTTGNVTLNATGSISEGTNGSIAAKSLTATALGSALLDGPNTISTLNVPLVAGLPGVSGAFSLHNSGDLAITSLRAGGTVDVTNAGAITLTAITQDARVTAVGGQTITADGLALHAEGGRVALISNAGGDQLLDIGTGGVTLDVANGQGVAQIVNNRVGALTGGTQTVTTTGALSVTGGAGGGSINSGIFQNQTGLQSVRADSISLAAATTGSNGGALISNNNNGGGDQRIDVATSVDLKGGAVGSGNRAGIVSSGNQTITGNADIRVTGGDSGTGTAQALTSNGAFISANNGAQTISANSITLKAGQAGEDTFAAINAASQNITVAGDVVLNGGANTGDNNGARIGGPGGANPGATNLVLSARNVTLKGGDASVAAIGSTNSPQALANAITINASGDVTLKEGLGAGARIGNSSRGAIADGAITINAANISLNGVTNATEIRTAGSVTLNATGSIGEAANGFVFANTLTTTSGGATLLGGPNHVSSFNATSGGDVLLNNAGTLSVTGLGAMGNATLVNAGDVNIGSAGAVTPIVLYALGDFSISSPSAVTVRGSDTTSGAGAAIVAGGLLDVHAGSFSLVGGAASLAPAVAIGNGVNIATTGDLVLTGGGGFRSSALLFSWAGIDLTIGGVIRIDGGRGEDTSAQVQTATHDGDISIMFTSQSGNYIVDGLVGRLKHSNDGFFTANKPAKLGESLFVTQDF